MSDALLSAQLQCCMFYGTTLLATLKQFPSVDGGLRLSAIIFSTVS